MSRFFKNAKLSACLLALALTAAMYAGCVKPRQSEVEQEKVAGAETRQSEIELGKAAYSAKDYETAVKHYRAAAEQGDAEAQYLLGQCCLNGKGIPAGKREPTSWMQEFYTPDGLVTAVDKAQAVEWFRKAAAQGHAKAQVSLGMFYELEDAIVSEEEAEECFEKAVPGLRKEAEQGDAEAQRLLGSYLIGEAKNEEDLREAIQWLRKSAEQDDAESQFTLGSIYASKGIPGVKKDEAEADKWFRKAIGPIRAAAEEGEPYAQFLLGTACLQGVGGEKKDLGKAKEWFLKAAKQGETQAQVLLQYHPEFVKSKE